MHADSLPDSDFLERTDSARQVQAEAARLRAESDEAKSQFRNALARSKAYARDAWRRLDEARAQLESRK